MTTTASNGTGIRLDSGDLVWELGDLALASGLPNLAQALELRVLTPLGSDRYDTRYGLDYRSVFTTAASAQQMRDLVRLNIVRTVGGDTRVQDIRDVQVSARDPYRRQWTVDVSIITATGAAAVLTTTIGARP
ncbi:hypothetical protein [Nocardia terpenica]|uniref:DUF2634 domain-containing protein n=1 Tax=Nocardia terpenica TaxID=455432 RepID=A0A6G9Z2F2_9NOCA|nr:hypothetical protein [Nocardia terpenica]QIS19634.1 hypothetical protein F6W96_16410 [Nocardia terpenica]